MTVHFVGCMGASMKRLGEICVQLGFTISGSDRSLNGHSSSNVAGADLVVYTNAVGEQNIEVLTAKKMGLRCIERAVFLAELADLYKYTVAISGTHGKTTTTGMLSSILRPKNACMHIGGDYPSLTTRPDHTDYFVTEACEYKRSFLTLNPTVSVILNTELDHTDYFKDFTDYFSAFKQFASKGKKVLVYGDDNRLYKLAKRNGYATFGLAEHNTYRAVNVLTTLTGTDFFIDFNAGNQGFKTNLAHNLSPCFISINAFGTHSVLNALAAAAAADMLGVSSEEIIEGLRQFVGIKRRQEFLASINGYDIFSDYAHHPSEIALLLQSMRARGYKHIITVFEPHTYTRTFSLKAEFALELAKSNDLFIMPVFAAREPVLERGKSESIVHELSYINRTAYNMQSYTELFDFFNIFLMSPPREATALLFVGAGSIDEYAREYCKKGI